MVKLDNIKYIKVANEIGEVEVSLNLEDLERAEITHLMIQALKGLGYEWSELEAIWEDDVMNH
ncbi:MAG: hypothetical protein ACQESN_08790 [Thermotogota bacterium]